MCRYIPGPRLDLAPHLDILDNIYNYVSYGGGVRVADRGKGRPSNDEAAAINLAIRDGAFSALMRDGPGVSMNAIVQASGLSRKTVYARHANKDALFLAMIRDALAEGRPIDFDRSGTIDERLRAFGRELLRLMREPSAVALQQLLTINSDYPRALGQDIQATLDQNFVQPLRRCLKDAEAAGELRVADLERTVDAIVTLLLVKGARAYHEDVAADMDPEMRDAASADYARFVADFALYGLSLR